MKKNKIIQHNNDTLSFASNNKGFTLVELIVGMLIAAIVMLAAASLTAAGSNLFRNGSSEVNLSVESETALSFISDILKESKDYIYYPSVATDSGRYKVLMVLVSENGDDYHDTIVFNESESLLCFDKKKTDGDTKLDSVSLNEIKNICTNSGRNNYLSMYVKNFIVTPDNYEDATDSIKLQLYFENGKSEYESSILVQSRNRR